MKKTHTRSFPRPLFLILGLCTALVLFLGVLAFAAWNTVPDPTFGLPSAALSRADSGHPREIFASISPDQARALMETRPDLVVLDVRTPEEYAQGTIPGAQRADFWSVALGRVAPPPGSPVLLFCAVGSRSLTTARVLALRGHGEVYDLDGGIVAWYNRGYPVVRP